jgi:succinate dehydrogenase/fumarate reductase flavoprotein subunit
MPTRPRHLSSITAWDIDTDVAVIGFGGAGACAAIEAHDNGARVVLFDLASDSGGSTRLSSAEIYMGGGTRVQKACGIEDSVEDMFRFLMASNGPIADEAKVRAYCEGSVDHFDWLTQTLGVPYKDSVYPHRAIMALTDDCLLYTGSEKAWPFTQIATPAPRGHNLQVEGDNGGPLFANILRRNVEERGIEVHFDARALTLVTDDDGTVHGVVVRIDQQERLVRARRGVVARPRARTASADRMRGRRARTPGVTPSESASTTCPSRMSCDGQFLLACPSRRSCRHGRRPRGRGR